MRLSGRLIINDVLHLPHIIDLNGAIHLLQHCNHIQGIFHIPPAFILRNMFYLQAFAFILNMRITAVYLSHILKKYILRVNLCDLAQIQVDSFGGAAHSITSHA